MYVEIRNTAIVNTFRVSMTLSTLAFTYSLSLCLLCRTLEIWVRGRSWSLEEGSWIQQNNRIDVNRLRRDVKHMLTPSEWNTNSLHRRRQMRSRTQFYVNLKILLTISYKYIRIFAAIFIGWAVIRFLFKKRKISQLQKKIIRNLQDAKLAVGSIPLLYSSRDVVRSQVNLGEYTSIARPMFNNKTKYSATYVNSYTSMPYWRRLSSLPYLSEL